mmetsp:Transcript_42030/g.82956  ORF Transcript_42030/g.82956 Transcript_42030/m.82956 type:complete len:102 (+) Transcript_42030:656-961(+)
MVPRLFPSLNDRYLDAEILMQNASLHGHTDIQTTQAERNRLVGVSACLPLDSSLCKAVKEDQFVKLNHDLSSQLTRPNGRPPIRKQINKRARQKGIACRLI